MTEAAQSAQVTLMSGWLPMLLTIFLRAGLVVAECDGKTCTECISSGYGCAWCRQTNYTESRCQPQSRLLNSGCRMNYIENPTSLLNALKNEQVVDSSSDTTNAVQIQPQKIHLATRIREEHKVSMTFRAANNFPIDLYFLFDNSYTMEEQIHNLARLATDIGQSIGSISRNYLMGYGVFQDKVALPFTETSPEKVKNPCFTSKSHVSKVCAPPYEFKHMLNMTRNTAAFQDKVKNTGVTGNIDHPEGSLDAMLQAITCKAEIGWRAGRKLLIVATDDRFHLAGDGRLAGIIRPNDGMCHMDHTGKYIKELEQDYPSISQLADLVKQNEVHIIFAVTKSQMPLFQLLAARIPQSVVELLAPSDATGNNDIQQIIEKKYKEMVSEVEIIHSKVKGVEIEIKATSSICKVTGTNKCKGLQIGDSIKFDVEVKLTECPSKPEDRFKQVVIYPDTMRNDQLVLEIEAICNCNCTTEQSLWDINSDECTSGNGTLKCGLCECHSDRYGQFCECSSADLSSSQSDCIRPGDNSSLQCSGVGRCQCGLCECEVGYSGPYCECEDNTCGIFQGEVCGGSHGRCVCGSCICDREYTGDSCECPVNNTSCIYNEKVCNNAGTCECGQCQCQVEQGYIGKFCETCYLCGTAVCQDDTYRQCAICAYKKENCPLACPDLKLVASLETNTDSSVVCSMVQDNGCLLSFRAIRAESTASNVTILIQEVLTCPEPVNLVPVVAGVVGGVVAIGLLILVIWKVITTLMDRVEYSKFEEELNQSKWAQEENPHYKKATTTYQNPLTSS